jgi:hypothetical protein
MRLLGPIATLTTIATQFSADGGRMSIHYAGNVVLLVSGFEENGNLVSFVLGEMCVVHSRQL